MTSALVAAFEEPAWAKTPPPAQTLGGLVKLGTDSSGPPLMRGPVPRTGMAPPFPGATPPNFQKEHAVRPENRIGGKRGPQMLPGLTAEQLADFQGGLEDFVKEETAETGLGPVFNDVSCVACHDAGGIGGAGRKTVVRFGRVIDGKFDPLTELGGSLLQKRAIAPEYLERVPLEANITALRITTPLFGAGLIEAIADSTILENVSTPKTDGVMGRAAMVKDPVTGQTRVGRFGWKAQHATLFGFAGDAYLNEVGITSRYFPTENAPNGNQVLLEKADKYADPEDVVDPAVNKTDSEKVTDFMRYLAPVPRGPVSARSKIGADVFKQVGCTQCHKPEMVTSLSAPAGLAGQKVLLYSDLLLHDMGLLGDGIEQPPAKMKEMRTAPLWGLRLRDRYLHDGRATTVDLAILAHDGEAKVIRDKYKALATDKRQAVLEFLNSL